MRPLNGSTPARSNVRRARSIGMMAVLWLATAYLPALAANPGTSPPVRLAVFDFELEDVSPASALLGEKTSSAANMAKVSSAARQALAQSGRYSLVDVSKVDAKPVVDKTLRNCDGCDAAIALRLGAQQSLVGVVRRATQTDYYVLIRIRDAQTGKILDEQEANFAGADDGWASGARMLIKHQILAIPAN
ncbi:MAG TPA: DUF2380 domain-containing protein [Steroidobacteraceae bacterium]